jgi:RNA polymerase sigma-70 factor (ECF subfamily)
MDYLEHQGLPRETRVMEVGCGWGLAGIYCAREHGARVTGLDADSAGGQPHVQRIPSEGRDPRAHAADGELSERIRAAVDTLPPEQKEVFVMRVETELPFKEIAVLQGVSINTALARMQYALSKLRPLLEADYREVTGEEA